MNQLVRSRTICALLARLSPGCTAEQPLASLSAQLTSSRDVAQLQSRSTTVLCVRKGDQVVIMADGQVTRGSEVVKPNVRKTRRIGDNVVGGFAGATADAFTLFERLESQLEQHPGQLTRAAVELAKQWRTDKYLRKLDATMVVADSKQSLTITGNGDVLEPHDGIIAIGSGGAYALAAARALIDLPNMDAHAIAKKAMSIAADACIYTNSNFTTETLHSDSASDAGAFSSSSGQPI
ncbi:hypothetical protein WJX72_004110 [[Myrmecia] bisecta]|uniref:ATP-dependent protease subunit HslV n=1 Tax=[Myrmecia] bisecta TaxID=41462 RepID=A0AAW1PN77_9CHLO